MIKQFVRDKAPALAVLGLLSLIGVDGLRNSEASAQYPVNQQLPQGVQQGLPGSPSGRGQQGDEQQKEMMARMAIQRNTARQEQLVKDTVKLLALANELKTDVDRTNKNVLSIDVIKKADEIEKLAKNVKERMKQD